MKRTNQCPSVGFHDDCTKVACDQLDGFVKKNYFFNFENQGECENYIEHSFYKNALGNYSCT